MESVKREFKRWLLSLIHRGQAFVEQKRVNAALERYTTDVIENKKPEKTN